MPVVKILASLGAMLVITTCIPSLHPLYTEKDVLFEPRILGTWIGEEGNTLTFRQSGEKGYELIYVEDVFGPPEKDQPGEPARFKAHLLRLGGFLFMDFYPDEEPRIKNGFYQIHQIPAHTFARVWIEGDVLRIAPMNPQWLEELISEKKARIAHERIEDTIVLTASTKKLQRFILQYAEDEDAFVEPEEYSRPE